MPQLVTGATKLREGLLDLRGDRSLPESRPGLGPTLFTGIDTRPRFWRVPWRQTPGRCAPNPRPHPRLTAGPFGGPRDRASWPSGRRRRRRNPAILGGGRRGHGSAAGRKSVWCHHRLDWPNVQPADAPFHI